jgi:DNA polymerase V
MPQSKRIYQTQNMDFYSVDNQVKLEVPLFESPISAGFPSPAEDYVDLKLDLNKFLIKHPSATFYVRVKGDSMKNAGIFDGDILIVDKALDPKNGDIAVCVLDGEFTVKRIRKQKDQLFLIPENSDFQPIRITEKDDFKIWGIVSYVIHNVRF